MLLIDLNGSRRPKFDVLVTTQLYIVVSLQEWAFHRPKASTATQSGDQSFLIFCYFLSYSGILTYYPTNLKFKSSLWRPLSSSIHKNTAIYYKIIKCVNKRLQMIDNTVVHQIHEHLYERYTIRSITPVSEEGLIQKIHKRSVYLTCSMRNIF